MFLIASGHPSHKITEGIEQQGGWLFLLSGYGPDLNPDELVFKKTSVLHAAAAQYTHL